MNDKLIKKEINEVLYNILFDLADQNLVDKVVNECADILYKNGFNDVYGSDNFNLVIIGVNLIVKLSDSKKLDGSSDLEVTYYTDTNKKIELTTAQWY